VNELANVEAAKKKVDAKLEQLESKVRISCYLYLNLLNSSRLVAKMEDMVKEKVLQKENELNATYDERLRNYEER
jgi:homeobox protein cut-like